MTIQDISIGIPSYNTIDYLKMAYNSLRRYYPTVEILIYDDGSDDGSWEWLSSLKDANLKLWHNTSGKIEGHTKTYNWMAEWSSNKLYTIFHSDMVAGPNYLENLLKHWKPGVVVSGTRIEPEGIYPPGREKILKPFGLVHTEFKEIEFTQFVLKTQQERSGATSKGIFAPWLISKEDFLKIGGHDFRYAPYPHEDADMFIRFALAGYTLIQSWDALCWHWISRGHRQWAKNGIGHDGNDFKFYERRAMRNYIRKWNRPMQYDEFRHPVVHPVYDLAFDIDCTTVDFLGLIEPWAQKIYVPEERMSIVEEYIRREQPTTSIDLRDRIYLSPAECMSYHDIIVRFTEKDFLQSQENLMVIQNLNQILSSSVEPGKMELGIFHLTCNRVMDISKNLIKANNQ